MEAGGNIACCRQLHVQHRPQCGACVHPALLVLHDGRAVGSLTVLQQLGTWKACLGGGGGCGATAEWSGPARSPVIFLHSAQPVPAQTKYGVLCVGHAPGEPHGCPPRAPPVLPVLTRTQYAARSAWCVRSVPQLAPHSCGWLRSLVLSSCCGVGVVGGLVLELQFLHTLDSSTCLLFDR